MITLPTFPPAPDRTDDPTNFIAEADTFVAFLPGWSSAVQTLADTVEVLAGEAEVDAASALSSKDAAALSEAAAASSAAQASSSANSSIWVSGTTYAIGDVRWSPLSKLNYRRITNGAGTTDPRDDNANWFYPMSIGETFSLLNAGVI